MKTCTKIVVFALVSVALVSCGKPANPGGNSSEDSGLVSKFSNLFPKQSKETELPLERSLVDARGRSLSVEVIAKKDGYLAVRRLEDDEFFSIHLETLGKEDQEFFANLPESSPRQVAEFKSLNSGRGERVARWNSTMSSADFEAAKFSLPIYLLFTGTSWCPPCKSLEAKVLNTREFQNFANSNLVLMKVDIPLSRIPDGLNKK